LADLSEYNLISYTKLSLDLMSALPLNRYAARFSGKETSILKHRRKLTSKSWVFPEIFFYCKIYNTIHINKTALLSELIRKRGS